MIQIFKLLKQSPKETGPINNLICFPVLVLLVRDEGSKKVKEIKYPETEPFKADNLKKWIWKTSGVYLPLPGCLEAFDKLADKMMESGR